MLILGSLQSLNMEVSMMSSHYTLSHHCQLWSMWPQDRNRASLVPQQVWEMLPSHFFMQPCLKNVQRIVGNTIAPLIKNIKERVKGYLAGLAISSSTFHLLWSSKKQIRAALLVVALWTESNPSLFGKTCSSTWTVSWVGWPWSSLWNSFIPFLSHYGWKNQSFQLLLWGSLLIVLI